MKRWLILRSGVGGGAGGVLRTETRWLTGLRGGLLIKFSLNDSIGGLALHVFACSSEERNSEESFRCSGYRRGTMAVKEVLWSLAQCNYHVLHRAWMGES
jgi:hypothetical protein